MLTIDVEKNGEVAVVHCSGRLVRGVEVCSLRTAVVSQKTTRIVILDLSQVEFMDAGGLNSLVSLHHWTRNHGIQLKLVHPSGLVREMLTRTRLNRPVRYVVTSRCDGDPEWCGLQSSREVRSRISEPDACRGGKIAVGFDASCNRKGRA